MPDAPLDEIRHCQGCRGYTRDWVTGCPGLTMEAIVTRYARCNFDGREPSPRDLKLMNDFAATLIARQDYPDIRWRELIEDDPDGPYWQEWHCTQPAAGVSYIVLQQTWARPDRGDGYPVRRIYEFEVSYAAQAPAGADRHGPARPGPAPGQAPPPA